MPEDERLDVAAAAERHGCSTKTIWRRIWRGRLPVLTEKVSGRDGRPVIKTLIRVKDLDYAFGSAVHDEHVRKIREAAPPLTREQVTVIAQVFTDHLLERDSKRGIEGEAGLRRRGAVPILDDGNLLCARSHVPSASFD